MSPSPDGPYVDTAARTYAHNQDISWTQVRNPTGPEKNYGAGNRLITRADIDRTVRERTSRTAAAIVHRHDPIPGAVGGRPSLKVQRETVLGLRYGRANSLVTIDVFAENPLYDDITQVAPDAVRLARSRAGSPPTLFTAGHRPLFTASGLDTSMLSRLPFVARHAAAQAEPAEASRIFEAYATNDVSAWWKAELEFGRHPGLVAYGKRLMTWLDTPAPEAAAPRPAVTSTAASMAAARQDPKFRAWRL